MYDNSKSRIGLSDFIDAVKRLDEFFDYDLSHEKMDMLYQSLKFYNKEQINRAIEGVCSETERLFKGANLYALIKKRITGCADDRRIRGWICRDCRKAVPITEQLCECQKPKYLSEEQKVLLLGNLKKLSCRNTAKAFEIKWAGITSNIPDTKEFIETQKLDFNQESRQYEDEVPF